jgi:hypothetical protein
VAFVPKDGYRISDKSLGLKTETGVIKQRGIDRIR